jgi:hypothetical protein
MVAEAHPYWYGIVVELDHNETEQLLGAAAKAGGAGVTATLTSLLGAATAATVGPILAAYVAVEGAIIKAVDEGHGVILTMIWALPGVVIPTTRYGPNVPHNWAQSQDGTFKSPGNDQVAWHIDHDARDPGGVTFRLVNRCPSGWEKALVVRDSGGGEATIAAKAGRQVQRDLRADQLGGQQLTFRKPGFVGVWTDAFAVGGLGNLKGGDVVAFTWNRD